MITQRLSGLLCDATSSLENVLDMIVYINRCYEQNETIDTSLVYIDLQPTQLERQAIWGTGQSVVKKVRDRETIRGKRQGGLGDRYRPRKCGTMELIPPPRRPRI